MIMSGGVAMLHESLLDAEREMENMLCSFTGFPVRSKSVFSPSLRISDRTKEIVLMLDLPGVRKEDVKIKVENGMLTISGERKPVALAEKTSWILNESWSGAFSRSFGLSPEIDTQKVDADLRDGILYVTLPRTEEALPREIPIK